MNQNNFEGPGEYLIIPVDKRLGGSKIAITEEKIKYYAIRRPYFLREKQYFLEYSGFSSLFQDRN
jgi:hypothetical protein